MRSSQEEGPAPEFSSQHGWHSLCWKPRVMQLQEPLGQGCLSGPSSPQHPELGEETVLPLFWLDTPLQWAKVGVWEVEGVGAPPPHE